MSLNCGIVGLPNVGKSTIFNALTQAGAESANYPFCTIDPNVGVVALNDPRMDKIAEIVGPQKVIPTSVEFVDIAGLVKGASKGEGLGNQFLGNIKSCDAIVHIIRCFEDSDVVHVDGSVDPLRDIEVIETELALKDLETVQSRLQKVLKSAKSGNKEAVAEKALLEKCEAQLNDGKAVRDLEFSEAEWPILTTLHLITAKALMYVANGAELDLKDPSEHVKKVEAHAASLKVPFVLICGSIEAELSELSAAEQEEFLKDLGITEPGLDRMARAAYELLDLISYFTAGEKEVRAWTVKKGASAPQAAGVIHQDFERGFIKAEIYHYNDLIQQGSESKVKEAGLLRMEGKDYIFQDGDIAHFRFNV